MSAKRDFLLRTSVGAFAGLAIGGGGTIGIVGAGAAARHKGIGSYLDLGPVRGAFCFAAQTERKRLGALDAGASQLNSGRALKLLTFLVGQCHDDRIFIDAKELGRVVVGIAED